VGRAAGRAARRGDAGTRRGRNREPVAGQASRPGGSRPAAALRRPGLPGGGGRPCRGRRPVARPRRPGAGRHERRGARGGATEPGRLVASRTPVDVPGMAAVLRADLARLRGDAEGTVRLARQVLDRLPPGEGVLRFNAEGAWRGRTGSMASSARPRTRSRTSPRGPGRSARTTPPCSSAGTLARCRPPEAIWARH
jgi:hypothetical protein